MRSIAVCSGKGSPGATFVAVNLAHAMVGAGRPALLLDLDPNGGDIAGYLGLDPRRGLYPMGLLGKGNYSTETLQTEIDERCGVPCISGFPRAIESDSSLLAHILDSAIGTGWEVVADVGRIDRRSAEVAARTERVLIVVKPDLISIHGAERAKVTLLEAGVEPERLRLVVSGWDWRHPADVAEIGDSLGAPVLRMIPLGLRAARRALHAQTPIQSGRLAKAFSGLAAQLVEEPVATGVVEVAVA